METLKYTTQIKGKNLPIPEHFWRNYPQISQIIRIR